MAEREGAMAEVKLVTPRGEMPTYAATPSGEGPWPGVVVIHDFAGMSQDPRPGRLAGQPGWSGRPDLYQGSMLRCLRTIMRELGTWQGRTFATSRPPAAGWPATTSAPVGSG